MSTTIFVYDKKTGILYISEKGVLIKEIVCKSNDDIGWNELKDAIATICDEWMTKNRPLGADFDVQIKIN